MKLIAFCLLCSLISSYGQEVYPPLTVANADITFSNGDQPGSVATVTCHHDFTLNSNGEATSCTGGAWTNVPSCVAHPPVPPPINHNVTHCPPLVIANSTIVFSNSDLTGSHATVTCSSGFILSSTLPVVCTASGGHGAGAWLHIPTCTVGHCGMLMISHGNISFSNGDLVGSQATVLCNTGFVLSNPIPATCSVLNRAHTQTALWADIPTCNAITCGPLHVQHGSVALSNGDMLASEATVTCNANFVLSPANQVATCTMSASNTGVWADVPSCVHA